MIDYKIPIQISYALLCKIHLESVCLFAIFKVSRSNHETLFPLRHLGRHLNLCVLGVPLCDCLLEV